MNDERIHLLQAMPIFGAVQADILKFLLTRVSEVSAEKGEYFIEEGSKGGSAFVLQTGNVSVVKHWNGNNHLLRALHAGDCFGEVALLDLGPRSASVLAESPCTALEITASDLFEISTLNMEQFAIIYMNLARELSRRLRDADKRLFEAQVSGDHIVKDYAFSLG